ncbi:MAG: arginyltransferase [Nitratireductor sp.]|nr:arginyltransferase [Nitratireductor sp.]
MTKHSLDTPQFYLTAPQPCPYLPGRQERKVFTHLVGEKAGQINDMLTHGGFRRSQNIAYRPACEGCRACVSTRVIVDAYRPSRNLNRVMRRNRDLAGRELPPAPTSEQFSVFRTYLDARHWDGGMVDMTALDYAMMVEDTHVETMLVEYRIRDCEDGIANANGGRLVAVALTDILSNGLSMVYSFFDPFESDRSLGSYMIADHVQRARKRGLPYVYLGYWVEGSPKMDYKTRFAPQEHLTMNGWRVADTR